MSGPPQSPNGGSDDPAGPSVPDDRRLEPGLESVSSAGRVVRRSARRRADRLVGAWFSLAQTGVAAALAWYLAVLIVGQPVPFFAPVSAVLTLGVARGQPRRRAVELALGVAIGIAVADLLVRVIGTGAVQIGAVVVLAMGAALMVGAGTILVNQAAMSAILVMTLPPGGQWAAADRFFDALIGGAVALLLSQVLFRRDPVAALARAARPAFDELATSLREIARALLDHRIDEAERALRRVRAIDDEIAAFYDGSAVARESDWLSPRGRQTRGQLYADAARQIDYAVRNTRVLARAAVVAVRNGVDVDVELSTAVATLADAADELAAQFANPERLAHARCLAVRAADHATNVLERQNDLSTSRIVGQVRATAADLLRGSGLDAQAVRRELGASGDAHARE